MAHANCNGRRPVAPHVLLALLTAAGCAQVLGAGDYRTGEPDAGPRTAGDRDAGPDGAGRCGAISEAGACGACAALNCCPERAACAADEECNALIACEAECGDDGTCLYDRCYSKHEKTGPTGRYFGCRVKACGASCPSLGATISNTCAECFATTVQSEVDACFSDEACSEYVACTIEDCPGPGWQLTPRCRQECAQAHPTAWTKFTVFTDRVIDCGGECGWGTRWECLDDGGVPDAPSGSGGLTTTVVVRLTDPSQKPWVNVDVTPRETPGGSVLTPSKRTKEDGSAEFQLPQSVVPRRENDYFDLKWPDGGRMLLYPGISWAGATAHVGRRVSPNTALTADGPRVSSSNHGTAVVFLFDCIGSIDIKNSASTGATFELAGAVEPPLYSDQLLILDPALPSGEIATFFDIPPSDQPLRLRAYLPGAAGAKRLVKETYVRVAAGAVTIITINENSE